VLGTGGCEETTAAAAAFFCHVAFPGTYLLLSFFPFLVAPVPPWFRSFENVAF